MPDVGTIVTLSLFLLSAVVVLAAVFGRRRTRDAAYRVLALLLRRRTDASIASAPVEPAGPAVRPPAEARKKKGGKKR